MMNLRNELPKSPQTQCFAFEGLGNRINCLASGMLSSCRIVDVTWATNRHCPVRFDQLFFPVQGLQVRNVVAESFPYQRERNRICWFYLSNVASLSEERFRRDAKQYYRTMLNHLRHRPDFDLPSGTAGIHFRGYFESQSGEPLDSFLVQVEAWLSRKKPANVFIASDCLDSKLRLQVVIETQGFPTTVIQCPLLQHDFDRSFANLVGLSKELIWFGQCSKGILSNSARSTVCDSARGFDVVVERTFDSGLDRRDYQLEQWVNETSRST